MDRPPAPLSVDELRRLVEHGDVDTVLVAMTDMQGRLQGKRCGARYFLEEVLAHGAEACNYLLAVDVEMNTVEGYAMTSWETGYGDFALRPDLGTLRMVPWHPGTALVLCDVLWLDERPVGPSPRQVLRTQLDRLAERGLSAHVGTELEFFAFATSYEEAWRRGYRDLEPANQYNVDYSLIGTGRLDPLLRGIARGMTGAGLYVESVKGECNLGQHEIAFRYADALSTCDNHVVYKTGAKEIAAQQGMSLSFMAKFDAREGNSCHIHLSLRGEDDRSAMAGDGPHGFSPLMEHFLAGQLACLPELTALLAPNINSYKRFAEGSFAPTAVAWGVDNRTCSLRVVGHGESLRFENRLPGGDVNPYLAVAALIVAGLHGLENELPLEDPLTGNAYTSDKPRVPTTLRDAADLLEGSEVARKAFGPEVVDHYVNAARVEVTAFDAAVTDWERVRGFERL
ncbi:glutamine synthetase family protein [Blastococcus tunisiensis]|uniref:Glutamine synthetase n=1 Tax=Blastococcus tunisiensis TaxID=1798228 RepID=A0A1I2BCX0_9ACTN|nr:glutamine synthetase family protein [Blastococcus sp. DSM 46838]SFE53000.1 glutamine synthetase [Blastococcus sp. DSM 46838]